jgi:hypothetical protein
MAPSPFGTTIGWYDMSPTMALQSGVDAVADDILVRITTPSLWFDPDFGYDVNQLVNAAVSNPQGASARMVREIKKDVRVSSATSTTTFDGTTLDISVVVILVTGQTFTVIGQIDTIDPSNFNFSYVVQQ